MSDFLNFDRINKILERITKRQQLGDASIQLCKNEFYTETVSELLPVSPACSQLVPKAAFLCTVTNDQSGFKCSGNSHPYQCEFPQTGTSFTCYNVFDVSCLSSITKECNYNDYSSGSGNCKPPVSAAFECGSFECKPTSAYPDAKYECQSKYGCNSITFKCTAKEFDCINDSFACFGTNTCDQSFDCKATSTNSLFNCVGATQSDSFGCTSNFECTHSQVSCVSGRYSCKNSVTCNTNGQPYTPPISPPPSE